MKSRRLAVIIALGVVLTVVWKLVVSHPYFALCVWTDDAIEGCEQNQNKDLLLRAVRSSVLPYSVRAEALCGLMRLRDRQELEGIRKVRSSWDIIRKNLKKSISNLKKML